MESPDNRRLLIVDDAPLIHQDFRAILAPTKDNGYCAELEGMLFGEVPGKLRPRFELTSAFQGREAVELTDAALKASRPFAVAFVDMRMPPGWDGLRTVEELWKIDPRLQVVICTAYSDRAWEDVLQRLDVRDRLLVVKKPFDPVEVLQAASTLAAKWALTRQAESEIQRLEEAVAQRTAALTQELKMRDRMLEEVAAARQTAEQATRMKSAFLANMSHEIRTPMNAILGLSHLILKTPLSPVQRDYVGKVQVSGQHLLGIINDILDFSKVEAGKLELECDTFDLLDLLHDTAGLVADKAHGKGLELVVEFSADVPRWVRGDALRLKQILLNYANNAVKFTAKGEVAIAIGLVERSRDSAMLRFEVTKG